MRIAEHSNTSVRLKAVHLLASTGQPGTFEHLRQLAVRDGVREEVKTALLEAMYKLDQQTKLAEQSTAEPVQESEVAGEFSQAMFETGTPETVEPQVESGFEFLLEPASECDGEPDFELEVTSDDELQ